MTLPLDNDDEKKNGSFPLIATVSLGQFLYVSLT